MSLPDRPSIHDRLRRHLDPLDLCARLGLEVVRRQGSEAYLNPLCHKSASGQSLQINLHTGAWNCKACQSSGMRGDLFHLVEYALTGGRAPEKGGGSGTQRMDALRWLCEQFGEPFDEGRGVEFDEAMIGLETFVLAAAVHLLEREDLLAWVEQKWGFDRDTVDAYRIGFMPSPILPEIAQDAAKNKARYRKAGLGWYENGRFRTRFEGRVLFPYLEHGRPVYLIGRATPWTPPIEVEGRDPIPAPKYHKLSVHSDTRPYVSPSITNHHLFNEPVLRTCGHEVGILEGVADAVAFSHIGVDVVSPVTINFNGPDLERFIERCHEHGISMVWILFDTELSGAGYFAAIRAGKQLIEGGLDVRVITLPPGPSQIAAREEIEKRIGKGKLRELEECEPVERKRKLDGLVPDPAEHAWLVEQFAAAKIDGAEWVAMHGASAMEEWRKLKPTAKSVVRLEAERIARGLDPADEPFVRLASFAELVELVAHLDVRQHRADAAALIAELAGRGVTKKADVEPAIAEARRSVVGPKRAKQTEKRERETKDEIRQALVVPPPVEHSAVQPSAPSSPSVPPQPSAPPAPALKTTRTADDVFEQTRANVAKAVEARLPDEHVGRYVAEVLKRTMGFMPFVTREGVILVRMNERVPVTTDRGSVFREVLYMVSGLSPRKSSHGGYIAAVEFHLARGARRVEDVSWSHVTENGSVFFPTGDAQGRLIRIAPGHVSIIRMSEARVPAVAGAEFRPFSYTEEGGGIRRAYDVFRWTSLSDEHRLVLIYWLVCLPILRKIGQIPIVRIEGGSSSGKTRAVEGIGQLVNGRKGSSVPTAAAMASRLAREMLTIDDNRETVGVTPMLHDTLLQATHLGAREKRKQHSDTETILERVCGALVMNGIEPIHDGRPELASRILPLRCETGFVRSDSPRDTSTFMQAIGACRDAFWSEATRMCAGALELDREHGERLGQEIEGLFGATRIGRMSAYLRMMYLAWVAALPDPHRARALEAIAGVWTHAFEIISGKALDSLIAEELCVQVLRYVFAHGSEVAEKDVAEPDFRKAFGGKYVEDPTGGIEYLGSLRTAHLARLARTAGKALNAPEAVTYGLRTGQLEERLLDGQAYVQAAGFTVECASTSKGRLRWTFSRPLQRQPVRPAVDQQTWETWSPA